MKIVLVCQEYFPETARGGIGTQTFAKAKGLSALGHGVYVISRSLDSKRHEKEEDGIINICIAGIEDKITEMTDIVQWITYSTQVAAEIESLHTKENIDIIDFPEWAAEGYTYLLNRTPWKAIPSVIQLHGPLIMFSKILNWPSENSPFYRTGIHMESTCVQLADALYSSSECSTKWIRDYYNPGKEYIPTIHTGVDIDHFSPKHVEKYKRPTIVFVGKIVQNKGVEELVNACCSLVKEFPDLHLKLYGRTNLELKAKLTKIAVKNGADHLLEFPGFLIKDEMPYELSQAHVFAAPSWYEGGPGFVYLEAMSCGLPVVGCSGSGVEEIITNGKNGILVPPKDSKALENCLRKILTDNNFAVSLGTKAREYVIKEADNKLCVKKLEHFYESVIEKRKNVMEAAI